MTKFEYWAMPHKDEKCRSLSLSSLFRTNRRNSPDVVASLNADSEYAAIFVPGGHGALIGLPESQDGWLLYSGQSEMTVLLSPAATARRLFWRFATAMLTH